MGNLHVYSNEPPNVNSTYSWQWESHFVGVADSTSRRRFQQVSLDYTGAARTYTGDEDVLGMMGNPLRLEGSEFTVADRVRMKFLCDLGYDTCLEEFGSCVRLGLSIMLRCFDVMLRAQGR